MMSIKISTSAEYEKALKEIDSFMNAFRDVENADNNSKITELAKAIEEYEDHHVVMPMPLVIQNPETLPEVIELKILERKMKRKDLAKRLYSTLGVDQKFIIEKS